jgi:hypothetical protein
VDVTITTAGGTSATSALDAFTYAIPAAVRSVSPNKGPTAGGTKVTIRGSGFGTATGVDFGKTPATSFTVRSDTELTATAPKHAAGIVAVRVSGPGGKSAISAHDVFRYKKT